MRTKRPLRIVHLVSALLAYGSLTAPVLAEHYLVYLVGGQSNANGRADAARLPAALASPQKDVRFYWHRTQKTGNVGHLIEDKWTDLAPGSGHGQTIPVYPKEFGPEISFGRTCADAHPESRIAIIKYSHGGSNLAMQWSEAGPMYQTFVTTTRAALAALAAAGDTYEMRGMIWQQGESDTDEDKGWPATYQANLTSLISRIRTDLFGGKPLPFVIGGLSDSQNPEVRIPGKGWHTVRQAQETVARTVVEVGFVNTDGFATREGEAIHFNHEGQIALGKAHADEMIRLEKE